MEWNLLNSILVVLGEVSRPPVNSRGSSADDEGHTNKLGWQLVVQNWEITNQDLNFDQSALLLPYQLL